MTRGRLIYVMGPSGSGKDSVMDFARQHCPAQAAVFAHRYITRPVSAGGENHVFLSASEFQARLDRGLFSLHWDSHGLRYGIGREIETWMRAGLHVVANGSRAYFSQASERYPELLPVLISASQEILTERLHARGRESWEEIEQRLTRGRAHAVSHPRLVTIDNSGPLALAGQQLQRLLQAAA